MEAPRAWAEIDLDAIARNLGVLRGRLEKVTRVLAVLKADAYGHGAIPIARRLVSEGVDMIGVGDSSEAMELRRARIGAPLLILGTVVASEVRKVIAHDVAVCVHSFDRVHLLQRAARALGRRVRVHLKVDTGMGRLGVSPRVAVALAREILSSPNLSLEGVCTHLSSADEPDGRFSRDQITRFRWVLEELREEAKVDPDYVHAANTAAVLNGAGDEDPCFDMVRCGIGLYGIDPAGLRGAGDLEPALRLRTQVIFLKDHAGGTPIGYARAHHTSRPTRIATIPIGYSDGYPYSLGSKAQVLVRGRRAPVVGRITMDYTMIDVGHIPGVRVGDIVTLVGRDGGEEIRMTDVARWAGTIPYEIPCRLGRRVARIYRPDEEPPRTVPSEEEAPAPSPPARIGA
jgi:alanine racemase